MFACRILHTLLGNKQTSERRREEANQTRHHATSPEGCRQICRRIIYRPNMVAHLLASYLVETAERAYPYSV